MAGRGKAKPVEGDVIEGEVKDVTPPEEDSGPDEDEPVRSVAVVPSSPMQAHLAVGVGALSAMDDAAFERNLTMLGKGVERAERVKLKIMVPNEDYGLIPGTDKTTLLKPGAEKLALVYGLTGRFTHNIRYGDNVSAPPIVVVVDSFIHLGDHSGPVVAQGMGAASSWEKRYRYRGAAGRTCPNCGLDNVIRSKRDEGWWCGTRDGGCGKSWPAGAEVIEDQPDPGKAENVDPHELLNTLLKMAEKRAFVDGVLRATASSGLFTQDMEEDEGDGYGGSGVGGSRVGNAPGGRNPARGGQNGSGAAPQGRTGGGEAPGPSDGPPDVTIVVAEKPDGGVRMVKSEKRWEGTRAKLEVIGKVGNRKHTAMVTGPLAEATVAADVQIGETMRLVNAVVEEIVWQEGKPTKKEVWGPPPTFLMDDVQVGRDGAWVSVKTFAPTLPFDTSSSGQPAATADSGSPPSAEPSSQASQPTSSPAAEASAPTTSEQPSTPAARSTASASDSDPARPPRKLGQAGEYEAIVGILNDPVQRTMRGNVLVAVLRLLQPETGELVFVGLADDIDGQIGSEEEPWLAPGDKVDVFGKWSPNGWVIAETVGKHREG